MAFAEEAAKTNPEYRRNVEALKKVQPAKFTKDRINVQIGSTWLDPKYYEEFVRYMIGDTWYGGAVKFSRATGKFSVEGYCYSAENRTK